MCEREKMFSSMLKKGDLIGIASPSSLVHAGDYDEVFRELEEMGFRVCTGPNFYAASWGFAASPEERAEDLHALVRNDEVRMIWFGGGEGADDVLPLLDMELIRRHPKIWLSHSDGTSILNPVSCLCDIPVFYGQYPNIVTKDHAYNIRNFMDHMTGNGCDRHEKSDPWHTVRSGIAEGITLGGYLDNFTYLVNSGWVLPKPGEEYILFLEEHSSFFKPEHVSDELARLEHSPLMRRTRGILFGEYSETEDESLLFRLKVLAERYQIPLACCRDFGHGKNHAVMHLGCRARLDTGNGELIYLSR